MNRTITLVLLAGFMVTSTIAQKKKDILLTINDKPVLASEFKRVYEKNLDLVQDESQKTVDGYMQLFIDYKLKVAEAYEQKFHEAEQYKKDFNKYMEQLSRNYIYEDKVTSELAREAYERTKEEINASHILIMTGYDALPQDTLAAYNKILKIRERAMTGEDFATLVKETSQEPNIEKTKGNLGYFSAFALVYPFESMAFATPEDSISDIVRTQYGYHIIKVHDRRPKAQEITVSHIMIAARGEEKGYNPRVRINEIYALLKQGDSFENLAKQFSDDKNSGKNGGKLKPFSKGDLRSEKFEEAAYALANPGDISEPVLSEFGWHIIRLEEKHPFPTYEEKREMLERRVKEGSRSKIVTSAVIKKIKEKFGFAKHDSYLPFFNEFIGDEVLERNWKNTDSIPPLENKRLFTIGGERTLYLNDFADYIYTRQFRSQKYNNKIRLLTEFYDEFESVELKKYFRERLEKENEEYAAILNEYRDGLLIYDVMGKNVWRKAKKDTVGQQKYFESNRNKYQWKQRVDSEILSSTKLEVMEEIKQLLGEGKSGEEIKNELNSEEEVNVLLTEGIYEVGHRQLPADFEVKPGISKVYSENNTHTIVRVKEVIPPGPKSFEDVKGKVQSDYQDFVEAAWMEELKSKHKVEINQKTLKRLKKELQS
ncbi:MAG: peptidylprolyl isomerase [Flavobacteriaceae bacterium]|nr:peptidylprolyl isomerase [Flavobacteriaceae bacterium]